MKETNPILKLQQIIAEWEKRLDRDPENKTIQDIIFQKRQALHNLKKGQQQ